jgi:hypothetical protein
MPVGGCDMGLNIWVEDGDVLFYAQKSGCFSENNEYFKLGRVRIKLNPNPFTQDAEFRQELKLKEGYVEISASNKNVQANVSVWVETKRSVAHVDVEASQAVSVEAQYESWRTEDFELSKDFSKFPRHGCFS